MLNTTDKIIKHNTGLLKLAEELGNVSKARPPRRCLQARRARSGPNRTGPP